ncbi:mycofactocin-coupled SDR family oxidoreductase [Gordonia sp. HY002]|uniref:mycofactocin-coupled SDR family oxidoreductase n=1 Tax=Gordonia zhenghanii TaxID=2911516 RepID=UPI001EF08C4B|nr:mycofactocin-coupled SDR family oxidoreductase [Gordonia zhenghanii]MCF8570165.1 mycofactocin-coupled SDR family oxidoreductase [Gordonia zhenghanii]MCF8608134.1 mycofactocin-coupled SDR family oxidoreductase [Gordonia zhenghanii]
MGNRMQGKVAFITGVARGQGRSHAVRLAEEGADIVGVDICADIDSVSTYSLATPEDLDETRRLVEKTGRRMVAEVADVRDFDALQSAFTAGLEEFGHVDTVVANAGIASFAKSWELTADEWRDMIDVNLTGVFHTAKVAIEPMIAAGNGGSMVFTSSIGGLKGIQNVAHYVSAKHGIVGLMRNLANELAPYGIRVNTVHPTNVDTTMIHNPGTYAMFAPDVTEPTVDDVREGFVSLNALQVPWVESMDISNAVLFLSSDEARYVTGVPFPVDAGAAVR